MAIFADKVRETSTTTGTGTLSLAGAFEGFRTFVSGIGNGKACFYTIENTAVKSEWEVGLGVVTDATPDTLSRLIVSASSNSGSLVNFSAGTKNVFVSAGAYPLTSLNQLPRRVKCATTANITLSGTQTIDGISAGVGDRVLVKDQSTASQNGIYTCASGSWVRAVDCYTGDDASGQLVIIEQGSANGDEVWLCTTNSGSAVVGTNNLAYAQISGGGTGDVVGPGSSTDNGIPRFDGTGGKTLQAATGASIDDDGVATFKSTKGTEVNLSDGATITWDWRDGSFANVTLGGNRTLAITNPATPKAAIIRVKQDGTGARSLTWPATVKWPGGVTPTLTTTVGRSDVFGLLCTTAGGSPVFSGFVLAQDVDL